MKGEFNSEENMFVNVDGRRADDEITGILDLLALCKVTL